MSIWNKTLIIYAGKCVSGILLCFLVSLFFKSWIDYPWSLISVVLILSPEGKDSLELAITRIKANFVGAGTGVLMLLTQLPSPWNIALGAVISLFLCDRLKLNTGARSTLAAMIIILLHHEGTHLWDSALSRVSAVVVGCLIGLLVTFIFHSIIKVDALALNSEDVKKEKEG
jgi:uncharacterized membrane protein YgaE (UPF0421/DUF939 family)